MHTKLRYPRSCKRASSGMRRNELTLDETQRALTGMLTCAVRFASDAEPLDVPFEIAQEFSGSVYDTVYVALALRLRAPFSTNDAQLCGIARQAGVEAWMISDEVPR